MKINKDVMFSIAKVVSEQSYAKRKQVGAVISTRNGVILTGYNGTPTGTHNKCENDDWTTLDSVIHAEQNCILKAAKEGVSIEGSKVFVTLSPCVRCAAMLLQCGVSEVWYLHEYKDLSGVQLLNENGIPCTKYFVQTPCTKHQILP